MGAPKKSMPRPTRAQTELIETRVARGWDVPKIARVLALDPQFGAARSRRTSPGSSRRARTMSGRIKRDCLCPRVKHEHGTEAAYSRDNCRCLSCALARHRYVQAWKAGAPTERSTVSIHATRLRLRALCAIGYSPPELAERLGTSAAIVRRLRSGCLHSGRYAHDSTVLLRTHLAVAALYDVLWDTPSSGRHARRMRNLAAQNGWLPPLALDDDILDSPNVEDMGYITVEPHPTTETPDPAGFVDEIAVEEAISGRNVRLTSAERSEAVRRLTDAGFTASQIAARLGVTGRTVQRRRAA